MMVLTFNRVFGTRVQDRKISLNVPDAVQLLAVFESNDSGDADLPSLTLTAYSGPSGNNSDLIVGEKITGLDRQCCCCCCRKTKHYNTWNCITKSKYIQYW